MAQHVTDAMQAFAGFAGAEAGVLRLGEGGHFGGDQRGSGGRGLKMPQLAMPVRVLVMGTAQTPSLDAVLELASREKVVACLQKA
jgi:glutamyl-tRNA synthetase